MSDLESRLSAALTGAASGAPDPHGLAAGARRRLRRRRTAIAAGLAAVVLLAVPAALAVGGDRPRGSDVATQTPDPTTDASDGWRTETWHGVTFEVPDRWGHGGSTAWCTQSENPIDVTPTVSRPDSVTPMIACTPQHGYGVSVGSSAAYDTVHPSGQVWRYDTEGVDVAMYPDDTWLGHWYDGEEVVKVVTPDRTLAERVLASVRTVDGIDPNGCPADLGAAEAATGGSEGLSLCRYDEEDLLAASRLLTGEDAIEAMEALTSAPLLDEPARCTQPVPSGRTAVLDGGSYVATVVLDTCEGWDGVFFSGVSREITDDVRDVVTSLG